MMTHDAMTPLAGPDRPRRRAFRAGVSGHDPFYIQATSPLGDEHSRVLKHGETFAVFDHAGDIKPIGLGEQGLYHEGTRFLSCLVLALCDECPLFLSSTVKEDNDLLEADLTNPDISRDGRIVIPRGTVHIARSQFLWQGTCYHRVSFRNYGLAPIQMTFSLSFEADFKDIFEVRGSRRERRGHFFPERVEDRAIVLAYEGLDNVIRQTRLEFTPPPLSMSDGEAVFVVSLPQGSETTFFLTIACAIGATVSLPLSYDDALAVVDQSTRSAAMRACLLSTTNERFNLWLTRSVSDLHMMISETAQGPYPYAGVPWFSAMFGRDGIITALECLWFYPELARGVLTNLAATQARHAIPAQDAEPGKILHETRRGEMAALGEIPFGRYYGSVDGTPLFVMLAGAYYERTADRNLIEALWPNIELALQWIDTSGDADGDGFVEYSRKSPTGLVQQGWKDSHDSVFHADGSLAQGPIALCEVQGYVYAARRYAAALAAALGHTARAQELGHQAQTLQERFEHAFWCEELSTYALALDGKKRPCRVRTSNAGHCLLTGIASPERARSIAQVLLDADSNSGWGIRTVAATAARYNPMSYHNGSVWPHENALIALGLAQYGLKTPVLKIMTGLFEASRYVDLQRMPELFCGFPRRPGQGPTLYPVACAPQSWAAAAIFLLLQACLGLQIDGTRARISFTHPRLPEFLNEVRISHLKVGDASVDCLLQRHAHHVGVNVLRRQGDVEIVVVI